jgi:signal transduction histidine kinase
MQDFNKDNKKIKGHTAVSVAFILSVATILLIAIAIVLVLEWLLMGTGLFSRESLQDSSFFIIFAFVSASVIIGVGLTLLISKFLLKPINKILDGMTKLSEGEYSTRLYFGKKSALKNIEKRFNTLAEELQNTEILRSDFINNFSHEYKTPIVSIQGLVSLMKNNEVSKEKQQQYLAVIEEETARLSSLTTNMLLLSKIENQTILADKNKFNLSEQIRSALLLFEKEWTIKNLNLSLEFDEHFIFANEDLLKQVWINLIDNAIKFSKENGELKILVKEENDTLVIKIINEGETIKTETTIDN